MFEELEEINRRPRPFEFYDAGFLWTNEHTAHRMLSYHLDENKDVASRNVNFINRSVEWICSHFNVGNGVDIADFGCGPGLYATRLAKRQANVTGIDFSKTSIEYARLIAESEQLHIHFINQNYLELETEERFDIIIMIMCDYCALSPAQRKNLLTKFHRILKPGGTVLLDVYSLSAFDQREEEAIYEKNLLHGFWSPKQYYGFLNVFKYAKEKVILDKYTIVAPDEVRSICNWLQYFSLEDLENEMAEGGFVIKEVYSDVAGTPFDAKSGEFAAVIRPGVNTAMK